MVENLLTQHEKLTHRFHLQVGVDQLVKDTDPTRTATAEGQTFTREIPNVFALFDEVGAGKTKQIVDASQMLYLWGRVDTMLVLCPGFARSTWAEGDPLLGEVAKHAWDSVPNIVHEFHGDYTDLDMTAQGLHWVVSNFEFVRRENRRDQLLHVLKGRKTWMVVDESWCIKGRSDQTKACIMLRRKRADRATILNGTPLSDGKPQDLYYQFAFLDPEIIGAKNYTHFKKKYFATTTAFGQVVEYQHLDELNARIAPYVLSRRTRDCFDLPPMLDPITVEATLSNETWKIYRDMRDEMVAWCGQQASTSKQAITKALRLSQICSGILGGLENVTDDDDPVLGPNSPAPSWMPGAAPTAIPGPGPFGQASPVVAPHGAQKLTKEISREKLDAFMAWFKTLAKPRKMLTWCRFRPELVRLHKELESVYPNVLDLWGSQTPDERRRVKEFLAPGGNQDEGAVCGITGTGAASLNFSAAWLMVFMSHDPALIKRTQSIGRVERPGQTQPMMIVDVVAKGPKGQKTIDHHILKALRGKDDMARWTVNQWRQILKEE